VFLIFILPSTFSNSVSLKTPIVFADVDVACFSVNTVVNSSLIRHT
jgi:hypothetical protein